MTHLTIEHREIIEDSLKEGMSFTNIGYLLGYHRTSISSEIKNRRIPGTQNLYGTNFVYCEYEKECNNYVGAGCRKKCNKFMPKQCPDLNKPPYVCNGCKKKNGCRFNKFYYRAKDAQQDYESLLKEAREGIRLTKEEIDKINEVICPLIKKQNQSVNQVYINHPDILYFSKNEFYKLINDGYLDIKNIDLPRKVKYKARKSGEPRRTREEAKIRVNRTYDDFNDYIQKHKDEEILEMDTVEGAKNGSKVFLTIIYRNYNFMLIYILDSQTKGQVTSKINKIKNILGIQRYKKLFPIILTDNGKEFFDVDSIEMDIEKQERITHVFYCDPSASYQKGCIEKNHEYIRYILPKGTSFDDLTQEDCNIIMSHINSVPRESLKNKTPYQAIQNILTQEELLKLGVSKIEPDEVTLNKTILK